MQTLKSKGVVGTTVDPCTSTQHCLHPWATDIGIICKPLGLIMEKKNIHYTEVNILQVNKLFADYDLYLLGNLVGGLLGFILVSPSKTQSRNNSLWSVCPWCVWHCNEQSLFLWGLFGLQMNCGVLFPTGMVTRSRFAMSLSGTFTKALLFAIWSKVITWVNKYHVVDLSAAPISACRILQCFLSCAIEEMFINP